MPAVWAATRIVERLAVDWPQPVTPFALVTDLELNRSSCYNILATLQRAGWVKNAGGRRGYTLGPRLLNLAGVAEDRVATVVQDEIDRLTRQLPFSIYAAEWERNGDYVVVAKSDPPSGIHVSTSLGNRLEFSAPALLGAFAAWAPEDRVARLLSQRGLTEFTEYSVVDPDEFLRGLVTVRELGYSRSLRQFNLSQSAVAAPVFDQKGRPILALCLLGFHSDISEDTADDLGKALRATADSITRRIGGTRPG